MMNTGGILIQTLAQLKELGLSPEVVKHLLSTQMMMDEDSADLVAKGLANAKPPEGQDSTGDE
jgi:hypothetical protein